VQSCTKAQDFASQENGLTTRQRKQRSLIAPDALSDAAGPSHPARDALLQELIGTIKATKRER